MASKIAAEADGNHEPPQLEVQSEFLTLGTGMFLWARLVLEYISKNMFYGKAEIQSAIQTLPGELSKKLFVFQFFSET